tara:strand:+ start:28233 stop:28580 length:348 start_codon:yes stop_codon:yes gene_type:complete
LITLTHFILLSFALFCTGLYGVYVKRNAIAVLMSIELLFNAVNLVFVAIAKYSLPNDYYLSLTDKSVDIILTGHVFALIVIVVAAAEVAIGLAIVINMYRIRDSVDITEANYMNN